VIHVDQQHWLERCRAGEPAAVEWLVNTHQAALFRLALSILDDPAEADEAVQETFVAALRRLDTYRGQAALATWLYAIAVNVCRSRWRKGRAWQRLRGVLQAARWGAAPPAAPEAAASQRETQAAVWSAVQRLGEKHRLPVILRYYHDLPTAEIAAILGISEGTVHSRLATARDRLRPALRHLHAEAGLPAHKGVETR
jgi:RNA polymerase sigma-70 factor (ECF subfamily)